MRALSTLLVTALCAAGAAQAEAADPTNTSTGTPGVTRTSSGTVSLTRLGPVEVGQPAPWFAGADALKPSRTINRRRALAAGRPIALVFFATWCAPCKVGLEHLRAGKARLVEAGLDVILVNYRERVEEVTPYLSQYGLQGFPTLTDRFGLAAKAYGVENEDLTSLPKTFVIRGDGTVAAIFSEEREDYLDRLLAAAR